MEEMTALEKLLASVEDAPWHVFYRAAVGFGAVPTMSRLLGQGRSGWILVPFLLTTLLMLKIVPSVIRRLVPFSSALQELWAERRRFARRYDSYQWRKLFWIGVGLGLYTLAPGQFSKPRFVVTFLCMASGMLGILRWREVRPRDKTQVVSAPDKRSQHTLENSSQ
jgi:hypothetical protein